MAWLPRPAGWDPVPLKNVFGLRLDRVTTEGTIATVAVAGVTCGAYYLAVWR
jgi:hypothetical protein